VIHADTSEGIARQDEAREIQKRPLGNLDASAMTQLVLRDAHPVSEAAREDGLSA
jgi:hypothetical protein